VVNMGWPRSAVYDPAGGHWYLKYFALLFCGAAAVVGAAVYQAARTRTVGAAMPALGLEAATE